MTLRKLLVAFAAAALVFATIATDANAQGRGRGRGHSKAKGKDAAPATPGAPGAPGAPIVVIFKDADRPKFQSYFVTHKFVAEPLPPGVAMNIARGKPLPGGISTRALPADLLVYVPRDPAIRYYVVGDRVVAVREGTIVDVLMNVLR